MVILSSCTPGALHSKNTLESLELTDDVIGCDREGQTKRS